MAPVVHGLERQYRGRVDFLYLYVGDPRNAEAKRRLGFVATPHFVFLRADGTPVRQMQGAVPRDSLVAALDHLVSSSGR
jgi:thioredoxin-like negative regulator of GroEL